MQRREALLGPTGISRKEGSGGEERKGLSGGQEARIAWKRN